MRKFQKHVLYMWKTCEKVGGYTAPFIHYLSTPSTHTHTRTHSPNNLSAVSPKINTINSTYNRTQYNSSKNIIFHTVHMAYNYNYLYIKKG